MGTQTARTACAITALVLIGFTTGPAAAQPITIQFTATVATVTGTPFGFDSTIRTAVASGFFNYDLRTVDTNADPARGDYPHTVAAPGMFSLTLRNTQFSGSQTPFAQVENFTGADTFRFIDGPRTVGNQGGVMSVNGVPNPLEQLFIAMTDSTGNAFPDDHLPATLRFAQPPGNNPFTFPNTFTLTDAAATNGGTLSFQINTLIQGVPEPSSLLLVLLGPAFVAIGRRAGRKARPVQAPA